MKESEEILNPLLSTSSQPKEEILNPLLATPQSKGGFLLPDSLFTPPNGKSHQPPHKAFPDSPSMFAFNTPEPLQSASKNRLLKPQTPMGLMLNPFMKRANTQILANTPPEKKQNTSTLLTTPTTPLQPLAVSTPSAIPQETAATSVPQYVNQYPLHHPSTPTFTRATLPPPVVPAHTKRTTILQPSLPIDPKSPNPSSVANISAQTTKLPARAVFSPASPPVTAASSLSDASQTIMAPNETVAVGKPNTTTTMPLAALMSPEKFAPPEPSELTTIMEHVKQAVDEVEREGYSNALKQLELCPQAQLDTEISKLEEEAFSLTKLEEKEFEQSKVLGVMDLR